jgi:Phospholipase_D-nuclease N-terminal
VPVARVEVVVGLVVLVLEVYCLLNCILTPAAQARGLPKALWLILIVLLPLLGSVLWVVLGRRQVASAALPALPELPAPPAAPPAAAHRYPRYAAMTIDERIRRLEEDLARLELESSEDGDAAARG